MLHRLYASRDFATETFGPARWLGDGDSYTVIEPSHDAPGGQDIVRYTTTGARTIAVSARALRPNPTAPPLHIDDYTWSADGTKLLILTNSRRNWHHGNTFGDYWVLELRTGALHKLGGPHVPPASLRYAKLSPDGDRVAYVHDNDLYVEHLTDGTITRLTHDASPAIINGAADWVNEEELDMRDGFRWSPDGRTIAYWQFDTRGIGSFLLINDTDSLYPFTVAEPYPKAGTTNSAVRVGVVSASGGPTTWIQVPGDPRQNYIPRMEWAGPHELVLQHLNRHQNRDELMLADATTGRTRTILTETDSAWVDVVDDVRWLDGGRRVLWMSERDGWRHVYVVSRDGHEVRLVTPGA